MKSMYGRIIKKVAAAVLLLCCCFAYTAAAQSGNIEFRLTETDCGTERVSATAGTAFLTASGDGINAEKIKWDTDPERLYPRMQGKNLATGWHEGGYWMIEFSGTDKKNITFSADMYSTKKGPGDYKLMYSTDGTEFTDIENSQIALDNDPATAYNAFPLPSSLDGAEKIYLKIVMASDKSVGGSTITGVKDGSTYINNIIISYDGAAEDKPTVPTEPTEPTEPAVPEKKIYYVPRENIEMKRLHSETGKYRITIRR